MQFSKAILWYIKVLFYSIEDFLRVSAPRQLEDSSSRISRKRRRSREGFMKGILARIMPGGKRKRPPCYSLFRRRPDPPR